jgi:hypothetical protein
MKRYIKAVLGGLLATLAAFGWIVTILMALTLISRDAIWGVEIPKGRGAIILLVPVFLIFSVGFYLAFRAAYSRNSN